MNTSINYGYKEIHPQIEAPKHFRGGRPNTNLQNEKKAKAYNLFCKNITRKDIAKQLGVGEKSIGKWAKDWVKPSTIEALTLANLKARLLEMTENKTTPIVDIKNLITVIQQLENK